MTRDTPKKANVERAQDEMRQELSGSDQSCIFNLYYVRSV